MTADAAVRPLVDMDRAALLALNNAHAAELSWLEPERLDLLLANATYARGILPAAAALIAFDQDSAYAGLNFAWFRARYRRFMYVDRVVVDPAWRGRGLARALYADLFAAAGDTLVACEVNSDPPNPASAAFHAGLGFKPVGSADLGDRTVRYLLRQQPGAALPFRPGYA